MNNTDPKIFHNDPAYNKAKEIYLRINGYGNPITTNGINREWIIEKIMQGLTEFANEELSSAISHTERIKANYQGRESGNT